MVQAVNASRSKSLTGIRPRTILVITYGGIGDILLTTPLIESLKEAFPQALIDVFIQKGRQGILEGNRAVHRIFQTSQRKGAITYVEFVARFGLRYDLAVSTRMSDRQTLFARVAGRRAVGLVPRQTLDSMWKRIVLSAWSSVSEGHAAADIGRLAEVLHLELKTRVTVPSDAASGARLDDRLPFAWRRDDFAVLHLNGRNPYKRWTFDGWSALSESLFERGLAVVISGGPGRDEVEYAEALCRRDPRLVNLAGRASLADAAALLRECRVYVGVDTSITHLAAGLGVPTVALYGPPEAKDYFPYHERLLAEGVEQLAPRIERSGPVWVMRGSCPCVGGVHPMCESAPMQEAQCMRSILPRDVVRLVESVLDGATDSDDRSRIERSARADLRGEQV